MKEWETIYIPYDKQGEYREAGWQIKPLTHSHQKEYALMAKLMSAVFGIDVRET